MLKQERKKFILDKLASQQRVIIQELCDDLNVSDDTVRRDLNELSEFGLIEKVHGGALPKSPIPLSYDERTRVSSKEKHFIAAKAAKLIEPDMILFLDGGTTNVELIRALPENLSITIFTNSIPIAMELTMYPFISSYFLGGKIDPLSKITMGYEIPELLKGVRADLCMLGICSIDFEAGITLRNKEERDIKKAFIQNSQKVIALSTTDKIGTAEPYVLCEIKDIDILVVDRHFNAAHTAEIRKSGIKVI